MTVWYSDHFGTDGANDQTLPAITKMVDPGRGHGRLRRKRALFTGMPLVATPDVVRLMTFKSSDRLFDLRYCATGGTAGTFNLGLHFTGSNHDGAVLDADLFSTAVTGAGSVDNTSIMLEATTVTATDRGKYMWQLAVLGGQTYTTDPQLEFDLTFTVTASFTTADVTLVFIADYCAGD